MKRTFGALPGGRAALVLRHRTKEDGACECHAAPRLLCCVQARACSLGSDEWCAAEDDTLAFDTSRCRFA